MTSAPFILCDDPFHGEIAHMIGARIDAAYLVAETGLVVLMLYHGRNTPLAVGIGPVVVGIGLLPRLPQGCSGSQHPLVAAMRAHVVKSFIRSIEVENDTLWITSESANHLLPTRLVLECGRQGSARVITSTGTVVSWPAGAHPVLKSPAKCAAACPEVSLESKGMTLLDTSDSYRVETFRRELIGILRKKRQRLERRASAVRQDLARLADVPRWQKIGSLLLAYGKTIARGARQTTLIDWETKEPIVMELAPDKPVHEQATEFFQKARRLQRGADIMNKRLAETEEAIDSVEPFDAELVNAPADWNALQEIARRMHSFGLPVHPSATVSTAKQRGVDERKPYHTFHATNDSVILVGRSSRDNDALVTRIAKPHDLWLHAKNIRGAHVVVPLEKNRSCPADTLVDAATLAAHFSDARNESMCEVSYVERRHVRKPKKSAPGVVTTQREKVIVVRIEKSRLARLLGSKVET